MAGDGDRGRLSKKPKYSFKEDEDLLGCVEDFNEDSSDKDAKKRDFTKLQLKQDHSNRPLWACADGRIFLETFSPLYKQAYDFLIAIAEPVCRPESMHEYNLTPHSLYAAVSVGLETETIVNVLNKLSKTKLPKEMIDFIHGSTANYGKVKLVLKKNRYFIESPFPEVLKTLLKDDVINKARISPEEYQVGEAFSVSKTPGEINTHSGLLDGADLAAVAEEKETHSFEVDPSQVENVKQRCLPNALNYPMLEEYDFRNDTALYVMNPNKFRACEFLIRFHEQQRGDKIIVFADNLFALTAYAKKLRKPMIFGATSHQERTRILEAFKHSPDVNTIFLSKVGDNSIDIPEANVIIQISSHAGSRRQEAQRLGRILRAKGRLQDRMAGGKEEYNAFFYSLVSTDTQEMYYSTKRQQFLIDQGYSFKVITSLPPPDSGPELSLYELNEQLDLLNKVLIAGDDAVGLEQLEEDADDIALLKARRTIGSMSAFSGASGMVYMEYNTGHGKKKVTKGKPKDPSKRHALFKKRFG